MGIGHTDRPRSECPRCGHDVMHAWQAFEVIGKRQAELAERIADLEADLENTLRAVLHHYGPDGAHKVTTTALELRKPIR